MTTRPRFQKVVWHHDHTDDPIVLWSEVGVDGFESRKVDEFRDGSLKWANSEHDDALTILSDQPVPPWDQIAADPEFEPLEISRADFEEVWLRPRSMPGLGSSVGDASEMSGVRILWDKDWWDGPLSGVARIPDGTQYWYSALWDESEDDWAFPRTLILRELRAEEVDEEWRCHQLFERHVSTMHCHHDGAPPERIKPRSEWAKFYDSECGNPGRNYDARQAVGFFVWEGATVNPDAGTDEKYERFRITWLRIEAHATEAKLLGDKFDPPLAGLIRASEGTVLRRFHPFVSHNRLAFACSPYPHTRIQPTFVEFWPGRPYRVFNAGPYDTGGSSATLETEDPMPAIEEAIRHLTGC